MKTIQCDGVPFKIGQAHGLSAQEMISRSISFYQKMFLHTCKMEWNAVQSVASEWQGGIEKKWPEYYDEIQGIADGASLPFLDILALNIRTEIAFGMFNDGCTSLYRRTKSKSFLAQNWDWMEEQKQNLVILDIAGDNKPRIKMITEAGIIGKIGFNEFGVGVCLNAIKVPGYNPSHIPVHLALRSVLDSPSADHALQTLQKTGIAASAHILIADKNRAFGLESTAKTTNVLQMDERNQILHANHLLLEHEDLVDAGWLVDSPSRQKRVQHLTSEFSLPADKELDVADIARVLDDHDGFPFSICRYEKGPLGMDATLFTIVMELREGTATVYLGRPCQPEEIIVLEF